MVERSGTGSGYSSPRPCRFVPDKHDRYFGTRDGGREGASGIDRDTATEGEREAGSRHLDEFDDDLRFALRVEERDRVELFRDIDGLDGLRERERWTGCRVAEHFPVRRWQHC